MTFNAQEVTGQTKPKSSHRSGGREEGERFLRDVEIRWFMHSQNAIAKYWQGGCGGGGGGGQMAIEHGKGGL